jgi:inner membrane protein involved in colicin E2 resistance
MEEYILRLLLLLLLLLLLPLEVRCVIDSCQQHVLKVRHRLANSCDTSTSQLPIARYM